MRLVADKGAVVKVLAVCEELGLTANGSIDKGVVQLQPGELEGTSKRLLTRAFLLALGAGSHVEVYVGPEYVCYCFLKEEHNG